MMVVSSQLCSLTRLVLPVLGFVVICLGAYLVTLQNDFTFLVIPVYVFVIGGFLSMLIGVFWNLCHNMKSKMYQRGRQEHNLQVFTVERPSSFPPSYEESQERWLSSPDDPAEVVVSVDGVDVMVTVAPPLYSQDSSEAPDCRWSWERPPRYSQVQRPQHLDVEVTSGL
ncbi:transmembrane protein 252-like [Gouania willdenowi]|uniref:transmembrane protein 252-like n=1 Tax=Gouania willdenowi TaxID=441366 RepID=UPI0010557D84|nr:transmembrane protein 252 [Gouania willdenowi]